MTPDPRYLELGVEHPHWQLVRYVAGRRGSKTKLLERLRRAGELVLRSGEAVEVSPDALDDLEDYWALRTDMLDDALDKLRTEPEALAFCQVLETAVGTTRTQSQDHHQSSKALVAATSRIAEDVFGGSGVDVNPGDRCVWLLDEQLHVTSRRLDGAAPGLHNPTVVWEIKEYWGGGPGKRGGSKMSDAVYECQLVGLELREFETSSGASIAHFVLIDGRHQWEARTSDLARFIDLLNQGLIDVLIVGREVETDWRPLLEQHRG